MSVLPAHASSNHGLFTCVACQIKMPSADLQRSHMKTDWHRYNLKRRVAELPPVTAEVFDLKIMQQRAKEEQVDEFGFKRIPEKHDRIQRGRRRQGRANQLRAASPSVERSMSPATSVVSDATQSTAPLSEVGSSLYETESRSSTEPGFQRVLDDSDTESEGGDVSTDREESIHPLPVETCFYCGEESQSVDENLDHMFKAHGLYIPEKEYLKDTRGLLEFISEVVSVDFECLKCGFVGKSLEGIRQHMVGKGHCVLPYETKEEREFVDRFYDFSIGEEDEEELSEENPSDENYTTATVDSTGTQLSLPNGISVGNRKYAVYYRQNIMDVADKPVTEGEQTVAALDKKAEELKVLAQRMEVKRQARERGVIETKQRSRQIRRQLKKVNMKQHFRDEMLGGM